MELIAHRGASYDAPENTLRAIRLAWTQAADGIEFDVVLSRDQRVVLMHDETTGKTAGVEARVEELTWAELQRLDVGTWKDPGFAGERIPLLEDVLATVPPGQCVYIDVKCGPGILAPLRRVVDASGLAASQVFLVGEFLDIMQQVKQSFPECQTYWNVDLKKREGEEPANLARALTGAAVKAGLDGLGLRCHPLLDEGLARMARESGQSLFVWTVNDPADARRMRALGVRSLATDRPGWLRARL